MSLFRGQQTAQQGYKDQAQLGTMGGMPGKDDGTTSIPKKQSGALPWSWVPVISVLAALFVTLYATVTVAISRDMRAYTVPVVQLAYSYASHTIDDTKYSFATPVINNAASFGVGWAVFAASLLTLVTPLAEIAARMWKSLTLSQRMNLYRWLPDCIINPLIAMLLVAITGDVNTFELFATFVLVHVANVGGLILEAGNAPEVTEQMITKMYADEDGELEMKVEVGRATNWPLFFASWIGLLSFVTPITYISTTNTLDHISAWEWVAVAFFSLQQLLGTGVQYAYYSHLRNPSSGMGLFDPVGAGKKPTIRNYDRYNKWLTANTAVCRTITMVALISLCMERHHTILPSFTACESSFNICAPQVDKYGTQQLIDEGNFHNPVQSTVPSICAAVSASLSVLSPSGYTNVDTGHNVDGGYAQIPGVDSTDLSVTFSAACSPGFHAESTNFFAFDFNGVYQAPGSFNVEGCCNQTINDPRIAGGCFGFAFTSNSLSRFTTVLDTSTYGPAFDHNVTIITNILPDGSAQVIAPEFNVRGSFSNLDINLFSPSYSASPTISASPSPSLSHGVTPSNTPTPSRSPGSVIPSPAPRRRALKRASASPQAPVKPRAAGQSTIKV